MATLSLSLDKQTNKLDFNMTDSFFPPRTTRESKGKSLIAFPDSYCVIDIETTGLSPAYDSIIEVSAIKVSSNTIIDTFSSLVQPFSTTDKYVDDYITQLTGITNEMLSSAPKEKDVISKFKDFIKSDLLIGHNVHFDINFLYDCFQSNLGIPLTNDFVDTMRIARKLHKELSHHRLSDIANLYGIEYSSAHRALPDCKITNNCYIHLRNEIKNQYGSLDSFIKHRHYNLRSKDIQATTQDFDETNMLYGKVIVFTGTLEKMLRKEAMQIVANLGGINGDTVTQKTNYLVLGNNDYCAQIKDGKSNKLKKAEQLKLQGFDIEFLPESVFYDMIAEYSFDYESQDNIEINEASDPFQEKILSILEKITEEKELPNNSLRLRENKNKNADSYSVLVNEPPYPIGSERLGGEQSILKMTLKSDYCIVDVLENVFDNIPCPKGTEYKPTNKNGNTPRHITLTFKNKGMDFYNYIETAIIYRLSIYRTAEPTFGCCSKFKECSDAKKCVHENKLYSTACTYRTNLEANRIFYGKNRNID